MKSGKVFLNHGILEIKARARLKVCNWVLRHVRNSQMSMKFKLPSAGHEKVGCMKLPCMLRNCNVNLNKNPLERHTNKLRQVLTNNSLWTTFSIALIFGLNNSKHFYFYINVISELQEKTGPKFEFISTCKAFGRWMLEAHE